jgi:hypothetical protein
MFRRSLRFMQPTVHWVPSTLSQESEWFQWKSNKAIFLLIYFQRDATLHSLFISGKLLYVFRVVSPLFIRSTHNCIYSIWYLLTVTANCLSCGRVGVAAPTLPTKFIVLCVIIERAKTPLRFTLVALIVYQLSIHLFLYLIFNKFPRFI